MLNSKIIGACVNRDFNVTAMKDCGIEWVRMSIPYPFADNRGKTLMPRFEKALLQAEKASKAGLLIMGQISPPGAFRYDNRLRIKKRHWTSALPNWVGDWESNSFYDSYYEYARYAAERTRGIMQIFQVSNEMNELEFRGNMTIEQVKRFLLAGAFGVQAGNPEAHRTMTMGAPVPAGYSAWRQDDGRDSIYSACFDGENSPFDYVGYTLFSGSWMMGGPERHDEAIDDLFQKTGKPVLCTSWGFPTSGGAAKVWPEDWGKREDMHPCCAANGFRYDWHGGHDEELQAEFFAETLKRMARNGHCIGEFLYSWQDDAICWKCGRAKCPSETSWGMLYKDGKPKRSFYAVKDTVERYYR